MGADWEQLRALNVPERSLMDLNGTAPTCRSLVFAGQHSLGTIVHTEEVTGSIPVSPTVSFTRSKGLPMVIIGRPFVSCGSKLGAEVLPSTREIRESLVSQIRKSAGQRIVAHWITGDLFATT